MSAEPGRPGSARSPGDRLAAIALPALAVALTAVVYHGVTRTYFFADDFACMMDIVDVGFARFVLKLFGGHILILRNAIFWATWQLFGFDPRPYYWSAFLIHLLNVWLVYRVVCGFTNGSRVLGALAAAMWGTSPLGLGTLGWYSVFGQQLVATFLLLVLADVERTPDDGPSPGRALGWALLLFAGAICFGVGIGVALTLPVVVFLLRPRTLRRRGLSAALLAYPVLVAGFYFGFRRLYALWSVLPLEEAMLDQAAFAHPGPIVAMIWHLIGYGITALQRGFNGASIYPNTRTAIIIAGYFALLAVALVAGDGAVRRRLLAIAVVGVAAYALIAIGRSNVYLLFKIEPAVAAVQPRYHYVGTIALAIAPCIAVEWLTRRLPPLRAAALVVWLVLGAHAFVRADWSIDRRIEARDWVRASEARIDAAVDAARPGETVYIRNEDAPFTMMGPVIGPATFPGLAGLFVLLHPTDDVRGRIVRVVEPRPGIFFRFHDPAANPRLARLLVNQDVATK